MPLARLKVNVLAGRSASMAVAGKASRTNSLTDLLPIAPSTGASFILLTATVKIFSLQPALVGRAHPDRVAVLGLVVEDSEGARCRPRC